MTKEEKAVAIIRREYSCVDRECDRNCGNCDLMLPSKEPILQAYEMAIKALEQDQKTEWIPVSERLPEPNARDGLSARYYLIQNEYEDMLVARYDGNGWEQIYQHEYLEDDVTVWMPLPEPYKESEG